MTFDRKDLSNEQLISFYRSLLWPRMIEEKMLVLLRQGKISKMVQWYWAGSYCCRSYIGIAGR